MISISEATRLALQKTPYLETALSEGLINLSALARFLKKEIEDMVFDDVSEGAIIMTLKRMLPGITAKDKRLKKTISELGDLTVRSNLVEYTFQNSVTLPELEALLLASAKEHGNIFITISQGVKETTVIASRELEPQIETNFSNEKLILSEKNLSSITITLPPSNIQTPGLYYTILKAFAWANLNIIEAISTANEFTIVFEDKDIETAFGVIRKLAS